VKPEREVTDREVQRLKRSLIAFGVTGFIVPILFSLITDRLTVDTLAAFVGATGLSVNRRSYSKFPWTLVVLAIYPIIFIVGCFSQDANTVRFWFIPTRNAEVPHLYYAILAVWALVNGGLIFTQYRINRE